MIALKNNIFLLFLFIFMGLNFSAFGTNCATCNKTINGKYLKSGDNKAYCSEKCFEKTLPVCTVCNKRCTKGGFVKENKNYCSQECLNKVLPKCSLCNKPFSKGVFVGQGQQYGKVYCSQCAMKPKCFACTMPGNCEILKDGRYICELCNKTAVSDQDDAINIFNDVRKKMYEELGYSSNHILNFFLTDTQTLEKKSASHAPGQELGLFEYTCTINTVTKSKVGWNLKVEEKTEEFRNNEKFSIYALYALPRNKLIEVCAHELAHDWMQQYYPNISDLKIKEGWAEYIATLVNSSYNQSEMNKRMETNPDKIYGDGFRMIRDYAGQYGKDKLPNLFNDYNK